MDGLADEETAPHTECQAEAHGQAGILSIRFFSRE